MRNVPENYQPIFGGWRTVVLIKWVGRGGMKPTGLWNVRGRGGGAWGDLRGGISKYFNNEHVCRKKHLRILLFNG